MRDPLNTAMPPTEAVTHLLQPVIDRAQREPGRPVAAFRVGDEFADVTAGEFHDRVRQLAKGLMASGVDAGERAYSRRRPLGAHRFVGVARRLRYPGRRRHDRPRV